MKTQTTGRSQVGIYPVPTSSADLSWGKYFLCPMPVACIANALKNYYENRENGTAIDDPQNPFPSAGVHTLEIRSSDLQSRRKWPDEQGRYWWKLTLNDGRVVNDFYWMEDNVRGWPDKSNEERYWFIVHHASSGTKMEGFSLEPNLEGVPRENLHYIQYTECGAIKKWMEEKDRNYLERLADEEENLPTQRVRF